MLKMIVVIIFLKLKELYVCIFTVSILYFDVRLYCVQVVFICD